MTSPLESEARELVTLWDTDRDALTQKVAAALQAAESRGEKRGLVLLSEALEIIAEYEAQWGDDYLTKKWGFKEAAAKIRAALPVPENPDGE